MNIHPVPLLMPLVLAGASSFLLGGCIHQGAAPLPALPPPAAKVTGPLDFTLLANDGSPHDLAQYRGKVVLLVNTASRCGYTGQYTGLEKLYQARRADGLIIIAIPSNDFMSQEPGTDADIKAFCSNKYPITFPLMAKTVVKGEGINPLYAHLTQDSPFPGAISWNFNKFLIGRDGKVVARFGSGAEPMGAEIAKAVEAALAVK